MKTKQRTYERLIYNHETGFIDVYPVPMPEAVPDHSGNWKNIIPIAVLIGIISCRLLGVM